MLERERERVTQPGERARVECALRRDKEGVVGVARSRLVHVCFLVLVLLGVTGRWYCVAAVQRS